MNHPFLRRTRRAARDRDQGFTLIELTLALIVVGVLGVLTVRAWDGWRDRALVARAQDDIIAISTAIDAYYSDQGAFPADLGVVGRAGIKDPWGRAYVYLPLNTPANKGHARKDHSLVPLNSDYDLYSKGADGKSASPLTAKASKDDILRANNGRFVGLGKMY